MQHFSHEHLDKLIAEHRLVSATIARLSSPSTNAVYARNHGAAVIIVALDDLRKKKVQLEATIDALSEYLNG